MDTEIYSEAVINRFMKKNMFFNDPLLEKYYKTDNSRHSGSGYTEFTVRRVSKR